MSYHDIDSFSSQAFNAEEREDFYRSLGWPEDVIARVIAEQIERHRKARAARVKENEK